MAVRDYLRKLVRPSAFPANHFHSPIVDTEALAARKATIWPERPVVHGIDFNDDGHRRVLTELFPRFIDRYDYPEKLAESATLAAFYTQNLQFSWLDARALFVLLQPGARAGSSRSVRAIRRC